MHRIWCKVNGKRSLIVWLSSIEHTYIAEGKLERFMRGRALHSDIYGLHSAGSKHAPFFRGCCPAPVHQVYIVLTQRENDWQCCIAHVINKIIVEPGSCIVY